MFSSRSLLAFFTSLALLPACKAEGDDGLYADCPAGTSFCARDNACVQADPAALCGGCACHVGEECCNGACTPTGTCGGVVGTGGGGVGTGGAGTGGTTPIGTGGITEPNPQTCNGVTVDLTSDPANCGTCGNSCGSLQCVGGACMCPTGQLLCNGACVQTATDGNNCGGCGLVCGAGTACAGGACVSSGSCQAGLALCGTECIDLTSNINNCGACGTACPSPTTCNASACTCASAEEIMCDGRCVRPLSNSFHCGGCNIQCTVGQVCSAGECKTTGGDVDIPDGGDTCLATGVMQVDGGNYLVQNQIWGGGGTQCINGFNIGFTVTSANLNSSNWSPASYPSIFKGCHWAKCSANSGMPVQVSAIGSIPSTWTFTTAAGKWNAAYDIWFNTTPNAGNAPNNVCELMIWNNYSGGPNPAGSPQGSATINGASWEVWGGQTITDGPTGISWKILSYRRTSTTTSVNMDLKPFVTDAVSKGCVQNNSYMTSVQAGFEIWNGGTGMKTNSFSVDVN